MLLRPNSLDASMEFRGLKAKRRDLGAEQNAWHLDLGFLTAETMTREVHCGAGTSRPAFKEATMVDSTQGGRTPAMQAHRIRIVVPENHRATVEFPATIPSGPVELIVLVPPEAEAAKQPESSPQGRGRLAALAAELAQDPRSFKELSLEERRERLQRLRGAGRGLTSGSEELARRKLEEIEIEERKFGR